MTRFQKATRKQLKLRLALCGPTGGGKTKTALLLAAYLGKRVAVIDSENRSASKYLGDPGVPEFDVCELESFAPKTYVEAIKVAEAAGYDVIVVDGITQAWSGKDGALEMVDRAAKRSTTGNSFTAWRDVTPHHNALVDALVQCKAHLIVTMRSKMEHVLVENERGKKEPKKIGMAPIQRDGMEYEMDIVGELDVDHNLVITKTRCSALDGAILRKPSGRELGEPLLKWLSEGEVDERPFAASPTDQRQQPADSQSTSTASRSSTTASQKGSGSERSREPDLELPTTAEGWRATHNALCDQLFAEQGIVSGAADDHGLYAPTVPMATFSATAKQHAGKRYDDVPAGYLRSVLLVAPDFHRKASIPARLHVSYLVARHEIGKLEQAAAERALGERKEGDPR